MQENCYGNLKTDTDAQRETEIPMSFELIKNTFIDIDSDNQLLTTWKAQKSKMIYALRWSIPIHQLQPQILWQDGFRTAILAEGCQSMPLQNFIILFFFEEHHRGVPNCWSSSIHCKDQHQNQCLWPHKKKLPSYRPPSLPTLIWLSPQDCGQRKGLFKAIEEE